MKFKIKRHSPNTIYSIVIAVLLILFCSPSPVRSEAVTAVLGAQAANYTCEKIKDMAQKAPERIFKMWANSGTIDTHSTTAIQIIKAGNVQGLLENIGDLTTSIQIIEEAVYGTPENALKILSKALLSKSFSAVMEIAGAGGAPGAVLFVCETLYSFNDYFSAIYLDSNLKAFANLAKKNPKMLDINYFQKTYLGWDGKSWNDQINKKYGWREMRARRDSVIEYANRKLLNPNFPQMSEWDKNANLVRTTIHIIIKDVEDILEKERKFKQLQEELKTKLVALKKEQAVLTTFQALRNQLLAMSCQDEPSPECLDIYTRTLGRFKDLILFSGDIKGIPPNFLEDLKDSLNSLYGNMESMDTILQTDYKSGIQGYCNAIHAGSAPFAEGIAQVEAINAEITAKAIQAEASMHTACASTSLPIAKDAAEMAKSLADQAIILSNKLPLLPIFEEPGSPPDPLDFSGREGELSSLEEKLKNYKKANVENLNNKQAFRGQASIVRNGLKHMISKCNDNPMKGVSAQARASMMEGDIKDLESRQPDLEYQKLFIEGLTSKTESIRWYMTSLKGQNQSYRECLNNLPDIQALLVEFTMLLEKGKADVDKAKGHAAAALDCYNTLKANMQCEMNGECETGYVCHDGKCVESETVRCQSDGNCPQGYWCSNAGKCITSSGDNLFGTSRGEDSKNGQSDLFSSSGGEEYTVDDNNLFSSSGGEEADSGAELQSNNQFQQKCNGLVELIVWSLNRHDPDSAQSYTNQAVALGCDINTAKVDLVVAQIHDIEKAEEQQREREKQQQAQQQTVPPQPQNQTNWGDVMNVLVQGMQHIQQGNNNHSKKTSRGSKPLPTADSIWQSHHSSSGSMQGSPSKPLPIAGSVWQPYQTGSGSSGGSNNSSQNPGNSSSKKPPLCGHWTMILTVVSNSDSSKGAKKVGSTKFRSLNVMALSNSLDFQTTLSANTVPVTGEHINKPLTYADSISFTHKWNVDDSAYSSIQRLLKLSLSGNRLTGSLVDSRFYDKSRKHISTIKYSIRGTKKKN